MVYGPLSVFDTPIRKVRRLPGSCYGTDDEQAFALDVKFGLSAQTFQSLIRDLIMLLSGRLARNLEPRRNGPGLNIILFIALLTEQFPKRVASGNAAGELIPIEKPEVHLHPQLQLTLINALRQLPFQVIATTHSTQAMAGAPLSSFALERDDVWLI